MQTRSELRIAARLLEPFVQLLDDHPSVSRATLEPLRRLDPDARISIVHAHALLAEAVEKSEDPDLGLKAGRLQQLGDGGALDYAVSSAATVREAIGIAGRYIRLLSDALDYRLEVDGGRAIVRLDSRVPLPRAAADFQASTLHTQHLRSHAHLIPGLEWWFLHAPPDDMSEYATTFGPAIVRFSAPCFGYVFHRCYLDFPIRTADSKLHRVMRRHAELVLAALPKAQPMTERVRSVIAASLSHNGATLADVAKVLRLSERTLSRRLLLEGNHFTDILDEVRHRLALKYVAQSSLGLEELAFVLGFSEASSFHRAFKRWTGQTPSEYRRLSSGIRVSASNADGRPAA